MGRVWCEAQYASGLDIFGGRHDLRLAHWHDLTSSEHQHVIERCKKVIAGDVLRADFMPGDKAIFHGRTRFTSDSKPFQLIGKDLLDRQPRKTPIRGTTDITEQRWGNWYDTLDLNAETQTLHNLFGNANVGWASRSNLQVAGQLTFDGPAALVHWHIALAPCEPDLEQAVAWLLHASHASVIIGHHYQPPTHLRDLWLGPVALGPSLVPLRQNFAVQVSFDHQALNELRGMAGTKGLPSLRFHVEGMYRRQVY